MSIDSSVKTTSGILGFLTTAQRTHQSLSIDSFVKNSFGVAGFSATSLRTFQYLSFDSSVRIFGGVFGFPPTPPRTGHHLSFDNLIRAAGGVSRMSDPKMIKGIQDAVSIPVMAKCRIGHFVEAQILEAIEIDYIDESEVLSPADDIYHIDKTQFNVPFVCGARDLGEALRRINEGASMIRTKGEPGTGDVVQAVRHMRKMNSEIRKITSMQKDELFEEAKQLQVPYDLVLYVHDNGKLPVVNFAAGGVATPADAALMMQLGAEGVFVGSGIFKSGNPAKRASAIVQAVTNYQDAALIAKLSEDLGEAMVGINPSEIQIIMEERGR